MACGPWSHNASNGDFTEAAHSFRSGQAVQVPPLSAAVSSGGLTGKCRWQLHNVGQGIGHLLLRLWCRRCCRGCGQPLLLRNLLPAGAHSGEGGQWRDLTTTCRAAAGGPAVAVKRLPAGLEGQQSGQPARQPASKANYVKR